MQRNWGGDNLNSYKTKSGCAEWCFLNNCSASLVTGCHVKCSWCEMTVSHITFTESNIWIWSLKINFAPRGVKVTKTYAKKQMTGNAPHRSAHKQYSPLENITQPPWKHCLHPTLTGLHASTVYRTLALLGGSSQLARREGERRVSKGTRSPSDQMRKELKDTKTKQNARHATL